MEIGLALRNLNAFPSEETRIHGPRTGSKHRQRGAERPEHDMHPRIARVRERERQLRNRHQYTSDWSPETNQQQRRAAGRDQLQDDERRRRRRQESRDPMLNEWNSYHCSQEDESGSWPTVRKCREKPLHKRSRS
jgi:hypothetical protein